MVRLNSKLLRTIPVLKCLSLSANYVAIALLNVRSTVPKIKQDKCFQHKNLLGFCETWLSPPQASPVIHEDHVVLRCDRASGDNKGGVAISVPSHMQASCTNRYTTIGITTMLSLPNGSHLQIALLYRSPSVHMNTFINVLVTIIIRISYLCQIYQLYLWVTLMKTYFANQILEYLLLCLVMVIYEQLVQSPPTDRGTHIYYNRACEDPAILDVHDTYYSDHDTMCCSIPLQLCTCTNHSL